LDRAVYATTRRFRANWAYQVAYFGTSSWGKTSASASSIRSGTRWSSVTFRICSSDAPLSRWITVPVRAEYASSTGCIGLLRLAAREGVSGGGGTGRKVQKKGPTGGV